MSLLTVANLKFAVFWSSRKLTSLRGTGASALPPLTIFHSLSPLQHWQHCTQMGHHEQQSQRCCIPAQHRRAGMTRPPRAAATSIINAVIVRVAAAVWGGGGGGPNHSPPPPVAVFVICAGVCMPIALALQAAANLQQQHRHLNTAAAVRIYASPPSYMGHMPMPPSSNGVFHFVAHRLTGHSKERQKIAYVYARSKQKRLDGVALQIFISSKAKWGDCQAHHGCQWMPAAQ
jgi:hypothetical protein